MYVPEYSITPKILKNISAIEYAKAVIETTSVLTSWENQLKKEAKVLLLQAYLNKIGLRFEQIVVKGFLDQVEPDTPLEFYDLLNTFDLVEKLAVKKDFTEKEVREIAKALTHKNGYRNIKLPGKTSPEELLAKIVQYFDWYQSLDGRETHPILLSAITKAFFEGLSPFKDNNGIISDFLSLLCMGVEGYDFRKILCPENYFIRSKTEYEIALNKAIESGDLTPWIEFYTEALSMEATNTQEKIKLLARNTKIAKATGRTKFTPRQERIVEYLQDYAILQNKDFTRVFPGVSEDSVLRDLKLLIQKGVVQKTGSTKSSVYELA